MNEDNINDTNYMDGKIYKYSTTLSTGVDYTYSFETYDIWNTSSTAPSESQAPTVGNNPYLYFLGTTGYTNDGVNLMLELQQLYLFLRSYTNLLIVVAPASGYPRIKGL